MKKYLTNKEFEITLSVKEELTYYLDEVAGPGERMTPELLYRFAAWVASRYKKFSDKDIVFATVMSGAYVMWDNAPYNLESDIMSWQMPCTREIAHNIKACRRSRKSRKVSLCLVEEVFVPNEVGYETEWNYVSFSSKVR